MGQQDITGEIMGQAMAHRKGYNLASLKSSKEYRAGEQGEKIVVKVEWGQRDGVGLKGYYRVFGLYWV